MDITTAFEAVIVGSNPAKGTMNNKQLFLVLFLGILFFPLICGAAYEYQVEYCLDNNGNGRCDPGENITDTKTATYEGLVPCGKKVKINGGEETISCQLCHAFIMVKGILDFLLLPPTGIVFVLGVLMVVIAGAMFVYGNLMAPGDPKVLANAQKAMTSALVGLIIIFGAWVFINTLFTLIGVAEWTGLREGWFTIDCPIQFPL